MESSNIQNVWILVVIISATFGAQQQEISCPVGDGICAKDKLGFEAISHLHGKLDDDKNGNVDLSESDEFLRDELKYTDGFERHSSFHGDDKAITVEELWGLWRHSQVYNWTVDDVIEWLVVQVDLPQYVDLFRINAVDGTVLPRLAANENHYLSGILGIKNPVHKQKLHLKAMDVVLFGPPKKGHSYIKDIALVASLVIAVGGCWFAYIQHSHSQKHMKKMIKDLDTLQKAEDSLTDLQEKLQQAQQEQQNVVLEKQKLETRMKDEIQHAKKEAEVLKIAREGTEADITRLRLAEEELMKVRSALRKAERELENQSWQAPLKLQEWLQLTYEIELANYNTKKINAEKQLMAAKEACEKLRKKRSAFMGSLRLAHGSSIDDVDQRIINARASLEEVGHDLQERLQRWREIERLCGFPIIKNPGSSSLLSSLYGANGGRQGSQGAGLTDGSESSLGSIYSKPTSMDDISDEDVPPGYHATAAYYAMNNHFMRHSFSMPGQLHAMVSSVMPNDSLRHRRPRTSNSSNYSASSTGHESSSSQENTPTGSLVMFGLEDGNDQTLEKPDNNNSTSTKYVQSKSLDSSSTNGHQFKKPPLVTSNSESCLSGLPDLGVHPRSNSDASAAISRKKTAKLVKQKSVIPMVPRVEEEHSSPEGSTDGLNEKQKKEKKPKKLLKFLKKDHDKTKVT